MAVFIETQTDPFVGNMAAQVDAERSARQSSQGGVRRPVRGVEIKQDTYAVLRVMKADGTFINVIDAAGGIMDGEDSIARTSNYTNFFIQSVAEERHEKQQIVDTFGDAFIFFFGESPRVTQVSGYLLNTNDFNWRNEFWANYEKYFRGTRLVEQNARLYLIYDDIIIEGYMLAASAQDDANLPYMINFSFSMFVTGYSTISWLGDPNYPRSDNSIDYSNQSTYGQLLKRAQDNRAIQKETNTEITRRKLREASGGALGQIGSILDGIRNNMLNPDPSIASIVGGISTVAYDVNSMVAQFTARTDGKAMPPLRKLPLRSTFRDNHDEFIGGNDYINARNLASPLNMIHYWQQMDAQVDRSLAGVISEVASTSAAVFDVMGRSGRAIEEISRGGATLTFNGTNRSRLSNSGIRRIPFGIIAAGER